MNLKDGFWKRRRRCLLIREKWLLGFQKASQQPGAGNYRKGLNKVLANKWDKI
jgi:hypothetical protein